MMSKIPEVVLTDEELARNMIKWKPYLAYIDNVISKALIQAASSRYPSSVVGTRYKFSPKFWRFIDK